MQNQQRLFGKNVPPSCEYCVYSHATKIKDMYHCDLNKADVGTYDSCDKFNYDPLRRVPSRRMPMPKYSEEDFKL